MTNHPLIWFSRHGQTHWNKDWRFQGQTDAELNDTGRAQAKRNGEKLRAHFDAEGINIGTIPFIASPLSRTRETMEIIREAMGLPREGYETDDRLKEAHYGVWEGMTRFEVKELRRDEWDARKADPFNYVIPKGESYAMLAERVRPWAEELTGPSMVVAHGGIIRALHHILCGHDQEKTMKAPVTQDQFLIFENNQARLV